VVFPNARTSIWVVEVSQAWFRCGFLYILARPQSRTLLDGFVSSEEQFLEGIKSEDEPELVNEVVASCRESGACHWDEEKHLWYLDYVRLRIIAAKAG
jgi:hypothetical protein